MITCRSGCLHTTTSPSPPITEPFIHQSTMVVVFLTTVTTRVVYEICPIGHIAPPVKIDLGHERAVSVGFKIFGTIIRSLQRSLTTSRTWSGPFPNEIDGPIFPRTPVGSVSRRLFTFYFGFRRISKRPKNSGTASTVTGPPLKIGISIRNVPQPLRIKRPSVKFIAKTKFGRTRGLTIIIRSGSSEAHAKSNTKTSKKPHILSK